MNGIKRHEAVHLLSQPPSAPTRYHTIDMEDIRKSFSKMKKDFKHLLSGKKSAPDRAGTGTAGERVSSSGSLLRPDPRVVASGHNEEGTKISTDISQARARDPFPTPADEGRRDNSQRKEADADEEEVGQRDSGSGPDVGVAAGSGPGREDKRTYPPWPITSMPYKQEPNSTWALSPRSLCLTIPLRNIDASVVSDHAQKGLLPEENTKSDAATNKKPSWKATTFATAKLLLRGVTDSADTFGPLRSVAGGLCFILENCEVWLSPARAIAALTGIPANERERADDRLVSTPGEHTC